jgi:SAM-dependent methyltransferase
VSLQSDQDVVNQRYDRDYFTYGNQVKTVGWLSRDSQQKRFIELLSFKDNWSNESLLDIGCGLGDLFHHIKANKLEINYKGVDASSSLIDAAKRAYPLGDFFVWNLFSTNKIDRADVVVASGLFNLKIGDDINQLAFLKMGVESLLSMSYEGVAFNLLEENEITAKLNSRDFYYYRQDEIREICHELPCELTFSKGYLPNDITVFLKRMV